LPWTVRAEVKTGVPLQVAASGPKSSNVMVPVGWDDVAMVAVSETLSPTTAGPDARAENANEELPKPYAAFGSAQGEGAEGALRASPL
jgi:hypothetical protein